jgi:predicted homoserine dehydrogenase-like protein
MLRYGIIGMGAMGREHAENLSFIEGASVTAISDPDSTSRDLALDNSKVADILKQPNLYQNTHNSYVRNNQIHRQRSCRSSILAK